MKRERRKPTRAEWAAVTSKRPVVWKFRKEKQPERKESGDGRSPRG